MSRNKRAISEGMSVPNVDATLSLAGLSLNNNLDIKFFNSNKFFSSKAEC